VAYRKPGRSPRPVYVATILIVGLAAHAVAQSQAPHSAKSPGKAASAVADGRRTFESRCAPCHGLDGRGGEHAHAIATPRAAGALEDPTLFQIIRGGIAPAGMPAFSSLTDAEIHAVIDHIRVLTGQRTPRPAKGDPALGERLYFGKAGCGDCHSLGGKGGFIASDLTDFTESHSLAELKQAILHPDQWIPAQNSVSVTTLSGEKFTGLRRNEDNFSLQLQDANGQFHLFMKSQIATVVRGPHSLMPGDYGNRLRPAELDDLISYLCRGAPAAAHRTRTGN